MWFKLKKKHKNKDQPSCAIGRKTNWYNRTIPGNTRAKLCPVNFWQRKQKHTLREKPAQQIALAKLDFHLQENEVRLLSSPLHTNHFKVDQRPKLKNQKHCSFQKKTRRSPQRLQTLTAPGAKRVSAAETTAKETVNRKNKTLYRMGENTYQLHFRLFNNDNKILVSSYQPKKKK